MTVSHSPYRRALIALVVTAVVASGGLFVAGAAQAAPAPPTIQAPLDDTQGRFTVTIEPAPNPLEQTVTVYAFDQANNVELGVGNGTCQVTVPANTPSGDTFDCDVIVPAGAYGFYDLYAVASDDDGDSSRSNTISNVRYGPEASAATVDAGPTLTSPTSPIVLPSDGGAVITGNGPALGSIEITGYRSSDDPSTAVVLGSASVDSAGEFSVAITFPAAPTFGLWELVLVATDIQGGTFQLPDGGGTFSLSVVPSEPVVSAGVAGGSLDITVDGLGVSTVGARVVLDAFGASTAGPTCPTAWNGDPGVASPTGPSVSCTILSAVPGVHVIESVQFAEGVTGVLRRDAVFVPATPTLVVSPVAGGAIFEGSIDTFSGSLAAADARIDALEIVVRDAADQAVCGAEVNLQLGTWVCASELESGADSFTAEAQVVGFGFDQAAGSGELAGYASGSSARSAPVAASIPSATGIAPPTMTYGLGPASIDIRAVGLPNSAVQLDLYQVEATPGEPYQYGNPVGACGLPQGDGDDGEGGFAGALPPTSPSIIDDCFFGGLEPGVWNIYATQYYYFGQSDYLDHYVLIPERPTLTVRVTAADQVVATGTGDPGFRVLVQQLGGVAGCSTTVSPSGTWACPISGVSGDVVLRAQQRSQGFEADPPSFFGVVESYDGFSAYTDPVAVALPAVTAPRTIANAPLVWTLDGYDGSPLIPGQVLSLSARNLPVQTEVVIEIRSTPQTLGRALASDLGLVALEVTVPTDLEPGEHTLVGIATPPGGEPSEIQIPVTVLAPSVADAGAGAPSVDEPGATSEGRNGSATNVDRGDLAAPSAISDSIPTIDRIFRTPLLIVTGGGLALALLLLVAFPAELLNNTIASNNRRIGRWYAALDDRLEQFTEWFARVTRSRAIAAALLVIITAVIFGFIDPAYGFDPVSLRMTASLALGLFVVTYVASWISGRIVQRVWGIPCRVGLQPAALLFAVVGVIIARLLDFSPGFLIGLVIGLDVLARVGAPYRVKALVTNLGVTVGLALLGWIGYSILVGLAAGEPGWVEMFLRDALVATAAEGLTAALASLLPLGFLAGHEIAKQSRWLWIACFAIVATLFALVVLPTADGETEAIDVGFWLAVMGGFAVVVLSLWALLHFTARDDDQDAEPLDPSASTVAAAR